MNSVKLDPEDEYLRSKLHMTGNGYIGMYINGSHIKLHRFLLSPPDHMQVDHINGNKYDNRKSNLRICTQSENRCNIGTYSNSTTGYKGIRFNKKNSRYYVRLQVNGRRRELGSFTQLRAAVIAYNEAARKYHGEFAFINEVPSI